MEETPGTNEGLLQFEDSDFRQSPQYKSYYGSFSFHDRQPRVVSEGEDREPIRRPGMRMPQERDTSPGLFNLAKASYYNNKYTRDAETFKALTPRERDNLRWASEVNANFAKQSFLWRGAKGAALLPAELGAGLYYNPERTLKTFGLAATAGFTTRFAAGAAAGAVLGPLGSFAGGWGASLISFRAAADWVQSRELESLYKEAGIPHDPKSLGEIAWDALTELPADAVTAGALYGGFRAGKRLRDYAGAKWGAQTSEREVNLKRVGSWDTTDGTFRDRGVNDQSGVLKLPEISETDLLREGVPEIKSSVGERDLTTFTERVFKEEEGFGEDIFSLDRLQQEHINNYGVFDIDLLPQYGMPWFVQSGEMGLFELNPMKQLRTPESLSDFMRETHAKALENKSVEEGISYLLNQMQTAVGDSVSSFENRFISNGLFDGFFEGDEATVQNLRKQIKEVAFNPRLSEALYEYVHGRESPWVTPFVERLGNNIKEVFELQSDLFRQYGVPMQKLKDGYIPQPTSPQAFMRLTEAQQFDLMKETFDLQRMMEQDRIYRTQKDKPQREAYFRDAEKLLRESEKDYVSNPDRHVNDALKGTRRLFEKYSKPVKKRVNEHNLKAERAVKKKQEAETELERATADKQRLEERQEKQKSTVKELKQAVRVLSDNLEDLRQSGLLKGYVPAAEETATLLNETIDLLNRNTAILKNLRLRVGGAEKRKQNALLKIRKAEEEIKELPFIKVSDKDIMDGLVAAENAALNLFASEKASEITDLAAVTESLMNVAFSKYVEGFGAPENQIADFVKESLYIEKTNKRLKEPYTEEEEEIMLKAIRESFLKQYGDAQFGYMGSGGGLNERRVVHFKNGEAYGKWMSKVGESTNIVEAVYRAIIANNRALGLVNAFGSDFTGNFDSLLKDLLVRQAEGKAKQKGMSWQKFREALKEETARDELLKDSWDYMLSLPSAAKLKALKNISAALRTSSQLEDVFGLPELRSFLRGLNGVFLNEATKNSVIYDLLETPFNLGFVRAFTGTGKDRKTSVSAAFTGMWSDAAGYLSGSSKQNIERNRSLQRLGLLWNLNQRLHPHSLSEGMHDIPQNMQNLNHLVNEIKMSDSLGTHNKKVAAAALRHDLGLVITDGVPFNSLSEQLRGVLQSKGLTEKEWNTILENKDAFIITEDELFSEIGMPEGVKVTEEIKKRYDKLLKVKAPLLTPHKAYERGATDMIRSIGRKLAAIEADWIARVSTQSSQLGNMAFLGESAYSQNIGAAMKRNILLFRGYALDTSVRFLNRLNWEGHGMTNQRIAAKLAERFMVGLTVSAIRWAMVGKKPEIDTVEGLWRLSLEAFSHGDVFPFNILKEVFADSYHAEGNSIAGRLGSLTGRAGGVGLQQAFRYADNWLNAGISGVKGDSEETFKRVRRSVPFGNWFLTDFAFNRLLLDNMFTAIDQEGAYNLFKHEMTRSVSQNLQYAAAPGSFTKLNTQSAPPELSRPSDKAAEQRIKNLVTRSKKEDTYTGSEVEKYQKDYEKKVKQIKRRYSAKNPLRQQYIDFERAVLSYKTATYYNRNRPWGTPASWTRRAQKKALQDMRLAKHRRVSPT